MRGEERGRRFTVLLVEDNPSDVIVTREAFGSDPIEVDLFDVNDGAAALDFLYRRGAHASAPRPDLILLDLSLPRKEGSEVLAEIKRDENLKTIPAVVLTTSDAPADIRSAYAMHANAYLAKTPDFDRFVSLISNLKQFWFVTAILPSPDTI